MRGRGWAVFRSHTKAGIAFCMVVSFACGGAKADDTYNTRIRACGTASAPYFTIAVAVIHCKRLFQGGSQMFTEGFGKYQGRNKSTVGALLRTAMRLLDQEGEHHTPDELSAVGTVSAERAVQDDLDAQAEADQQQYCAAIVINMLQGTADIESTRANEAKACLSP
jgi:hypothetical protein